MYLLLWSLIWLLNLLWTHEFRELSWSDFFMVSRLGRKPVLGFTLVLQGVTALVQAGSVSWLMFCILNLLRGLGQISSYSASLILGERQTGSPVLVSRQLSVLWSFCSGSEMLGKSARVTFTMVGHSLGFVIGYALLPCFAYFIRGWRMLLVASAVPCFLFIPMWW